MARPLLRFGSTGDAVKLLQQALNQGDSILPPLDVDGDFGHLTRGRVVEHQRSNALVPDGIVGDQTHASLEDMYKIVTGLLKSIGGPPDQDSARLRIGGVAQGALGSFGWPKGLTPPDGSFRIAGKTCANVETRERQGGLAMAHIFQMAGHPSAGKCLTISKKAEDMYAGRGDFQDKEFTAQDRNTIDIPSWCGIFCLYCHRLAGLNLPDWPLQIRGNFPIDKKNFPNASYEHVKPENLKVGDIGIIEPFGGRNHHFLVTGFPSGEGTKTPTVTSIDGNAGDVQTILTKTYSIGAGPDNLGAFAITGGIGTERVMLITPVWSNVLANG
jgi:hypothetical protein